MVKWYHSGLLIRKFRVQVPIQALRFITVKIKKKEINIMESYYYREIEYY